jgi:hypothetical protein
VTFVLRFCNLYCGPSVFNLAVSTIESSQSGYAESDTPDESESAGSMNFRILPSFGCRSTANRRSSTDVDTFLFVDNSLPRHDKAKVLRTRLHE